MLSAWEALFAVIGGLTSLLVNLLYVSILYFSGYFSGFFYASRRPIPKNDPLCIHNASDEHSHRHQQSHLETISEEVYKSAWLQLAPNNREGSCHSDRNSVREQRSLAGTPDSLLNGSSHSSLRRTSSSISITSQGSRHSEAKVSPSSGRYFVVLKNQNLFIYSSEQQTNCLAALCLEECQVELDDLDGRLLPDELFGPGYFVSVSTHKGTLFGPYDSLTLKFETGMQKEDWFYALRKAVVLSNPLVMRQMDQWTSEVRKYFCTLKRNVTSVIGASKPTVTQTSSSREQQSSRSTNSDPLQVINLLVGRIFFNISQAGLIEQQIIGKFRRKLEISPLPPFLEGLSITEIALSKQPPLLSQVELHRCTDVGDLSFFCSLSLASEIAIVVEGKVVSDALPLVKRLKRFTIPITVRATIRSVSGRALVHLKRPPSDRIWFGFLEKPTIDLQLEPVIASTTVSIAIILEFLEGCAIEAINNSIVYPSMEDVAVIPQYESTQFPLVCQCLNAYRNEDDSFDLRTVSPSLKQRSNSAGSFTKQQGTSVESSSSKQRGDSVGSSSTTTSYYIPPMPPNATGGSSTSESPSSTEGELTNGGSKEEGTPSSSSKNISILSQSFVHSSTTSLLDETNYVFISRPKSALTRRTRSSSHNKP